MAMNLRGLQGMKGLSGLSPEDRRKWENANADIIRGKSINAIENLYRNQQYASKYGLENFYSHTPEQRNAQLKSGFLNEEIEKRYSPYTGKDKYGNYMVDPNKGVGNAETYHKIINMSDSSKERLIDSGWVTNPKMEALKKENSIDEGLYNFIPGYNLYNRIRNRKNNTLGTFNYDLIRSLLPAMSMADEFIYAKLSSDNASIFDTLYAEDLKQKERELQPYINKQYQDIVKNMSDTEVKNTFNELITPIKDKNIGNGQFKAFYKNGKDVEDEMKNFSIDDMRRYIAKSTVLNEALDPMTAHDALDNYAKEYIANNQSILKQTKALANDAFITAATYTADKFNSIRQGYNTALDLIKGNVKAYADKDGNIVPVNQIKTAKDGTKYYINKDGNAISVSQIETSRVALDSMGKDSEGNERDLFWNNRLLTQAEQYGTLDRDEIEQFNKLGASPYSIVYKPGDNSHMIYESLKMMGFAAADILATAIPVGGQALGASMMATKGASMLSKTASTLGKGIYTLNKGLQKIQPTIAAGAIGNAYSRGAYGEMFAQNMQTLQESTFKSAREDFDTNYSKNKEFKAQIDKEVDTEFKKLKDAQEKELKKKNVKLSKSDNESNDKLLRNQALQNVYNLYVNSKAKELQNSTDYIDKVGKASEIAGNAAAILAITDGAKYALVNNFGFRKYLFSTTADRTASAVNRLSSKVIENEGRLSRVENSFERFAKNKNWSSKTAERLGKVEDFGKVLGSQAWGGAWTNFTDEMQTWGSKQINQDNFSKYINGDYNKESSNILYDALNNVYSYYKGANESLEKESTWNAGFVGALGSMISVFPNIASIAQSIATKEGRDNFKNADWGEKVNMLVSNGLLNEYYSKQAGKKSIDNAIQVVNNILDNYNNFNTLKDILSLDRASIDTTNQNDKDVLDYLKAIRAIQTLQQFQNEEGVKDQSNSRVKRWLNRQLNDFKGTSTEKSTLDLIAENSSILSNTLTELNKIVDGNITEEEAKSYLSEYYSKNPGIDQSAENNKKALEEIQDNAKKLLDASKRVTDINQQLSQIEEERGEINPYIKAKLIEKAALNEVIDEKTKSLEAKITGSETFSPTNSDPIEVFGTREALIGQVNSLERSQKELEKLKSKAEEEFEKKNSELEEFEDTHDLDKLSLDEKEKYKNLSDETDRAHLQLSYLEETLDKTIIQKDKTKEYRDNAPMDNSQERVLSKDEILHLSPETRARMLDKANLSDYSKEQQEIIKELINDITLKDPSILQDIQDQGRLVMQKRANAKSYELMLDNPNAAALQFEAEDSVNKDLNSNMSKYRIINGVNNFLSEVLNNIYNNENLSIEERTAISKDIAFKQLSTLHPSILDFLDSLDTSNSDFNYGFIPNFKLEITKAKEYSHTLEDISKTIDSMNLEDDSTFRDSVNTLLENAGTTTRNEVIDVFEKVINSDEVSQEDKDKYSKLLNAVRGLENQRNSTIIETNQEKKDRQELQKQQENQEEQKIEEVEKEIDAEEEKDVEKSNEEELQKHKEDEVIEGEDIDLGIESQTPESLESPTIEKQAESENTSLVTITNNNTNQENILTPTSDNMLGNAMYFYDVKSLEENGKEVQRKGSDPNDKMSRFFNWMNNEKIKLQDIIDNELNDIIKVNNKLQILFVNPKSNSTDDAIMDNFSLLCVEYTDDIKKIHNEERGGVITSNGKQYLIVGTLGYAFKNNAQRDTFNQVLNIGKENRDHYFTSNPTDRFFVDSTMNTEVEQMTSGRIVRELIDDNSTEIRSITELLADPNRNPKDYKLQDLKWGIQYDDKLVTVGLSSRNTFYPPRDALSNSGAVFLMAEAANGNYIPIAILPTMLSDIKDGTLKTQLNNLFNELTSLRYEDRYKAISQLVQMLYLSNDDNNILIGQPGRNTVSTIKDGVILRTFNLEDPNFNRMELINAIMELNPRINITTSILKNTTQLKVYSEAGALNTDAAKIGTSNASYTVYAIGNDGKPIKTEPVKNTESTSAEINSDLSKADYKKNNSVYHKGSEYRKRDNKWFDINWKEVTDPVLINQLQWENYIRKNDLSPSLISNDKYGNKNVKYYVINSNTSDAKVIKVFTNGNIAELNTEDSKEVIKIIQNNELKKSQEEAAKEKRERQESNEKSLREGNVKELENEDVDLGEVLSEEQIEKQSQGDFSAENKSTISESAKHANEVVNKIITDTLGLILDEEKGVYRDSSGREYARVTSVIQAIEGIKRFDPNSPWVLPSTQIGNSVDKLVRDFFANNGKLLGDIDAIEQLYPNLSFQDIVSFGNQLLKLKEKFDSMGLTIIPRDITVTGEVEVIGEDDKKYKLPVAGTLDLLAYDKDGNFYIFDMKTNRSSINDKKTKKWANQLSLYKQFLEQKYGIKVKETAIIPIKVNYPAPKGYGNAKTQYTLWEERGVKGQLYTSTNAEDALKAKWTLFREAAPKLLPNLPITTNPIEVLYSELTNTERELLFPEADGTLDFHKGTTNVESKNSNEDINSTGNESLTSLQKSNTDKPSTISSAIKDRRYSKRIRDILKEKGFNGKLSEIETWLKEHNMPVSNITDIDSWIDMLQNCR